MRILKFIVDQQTLKKDPMCDFSGLTKGTKGYLKAQFSFSKEWNGCTKVVGFYSSYGDEYRPQVLDKDNSCMIPDEALKRETFFIKVIAKRNKFLITTNKFKVTQNGGRV